MVVLGIVLWLLIGIGVAMEEWDEQGHSSTYSVVCMCLWPVLLGIVLVKVYNWLLSKE